MRGFTSRTKHANVGVLEEVPETEQARGPNSAKHLSVVEAVHPQATLGKQSLSPHPAIFCVEMRCFSLSFKAVPQVLKTHAC